MPALTLDALLRNLKRGVLEPVYLLRGDEDVLKDEALRQLVDAAIGGDANRDFNLDTRFATDLTPEQFHALVNTPPMLAARRAVVVRGMDQVVKRKTKLRDEVIRYLNAPNPTTVLALVFGAGEEPDAELLRASTPVDLEPLAPERVPRWVQHRAGILGLTLEPEAATLLIGAVGNDLSTLARELEKLASLTADTHRPATAADVTGLVGVRQGETVYDLVEAALSRRVARAAQLVEPVLEQAGMSGVKIVALLGTHLVGTAVARAERDRGTRRLPEAIFRHLLATRPYGLRNWKDEAARWSEWSALWTPEALRAALKAALAADIALKTATISDEKGIVTQLVLGFAPMKREAA
ncbi:MAG TPA: DNA polymerase III subunit delta [Gemmatimonadales bacterium]|nr:DNA polymerase III subunit delta [Gemmatimonadales bacterium]